ncbi:MAG: hypothetical protein IPM83_06645 [Ignavibacteria bacterium]|nr:hypothetical protein [Ignavibacteria bacterium]
MIMKTAIRIPFRLSIRSTKYPDGSARPIAGIASANPTIANISGSCVSAYTYQLTTSACMCHPMARKRRSWRKARNSIGLTSDLCNWTDVWVFGYAAL